MTPLAYRPKVEDGEQALYFDDNHLSITSALRLADFMLERMPTEPPR